MVVMAAGDKLVEGGGAKRKQGKREDQDSGVSSRQPDKGLHDLLLLITGLRGDTGHQPTLNPLLCVCQITQCPSRHRQ